MQPRLLTAICWKWLIFAGSVRLKTDRRRRPCASASVICPSDSNWSCCSFSFERHLSQQSLTLRSMPLAGGLPRRLQRALVARRARRRGHRARRHQYERHDRRSDRGRASSSCHVASSREGRPAAAGQRGASPNASDRNIGRRNPVPAALGGTVPGRGDRLGQLADAGRDGGLGDLAVAQHQHRRAALGRCAVLGQRLEPDPSPSRPPRGSLLVVDRARARRSRACRRRCRAPSRRAAPRSARHQGVAAAAVELPHAAQVPVELAAARGSRRTRAGRCGRCRGRPGASRRRPSTSAAGTTSQPMRRPGARVFQAVPA